MFPTIKENFLIWRRKDSKLNSHWSNTKKGTIIVCSVRSVSPSFRLLCHTQTSKITDEELRRGGLICVRQSDGGRCWKIIFWKKIFLLKYFCPKSFPMNIFLSVIIKRTIICAPSGPWVRFVSFVPPPQL